MKDKKNGADVAVPLEHLKSDINSLLPDTDPIDDTIVPPLPKDPEDNESTGFNPYDSGTTDTSKSWAAHARFKRSF